MLGRFTGSAVLVHDGIELVHPWLQGWYGELTFEAPWAPRLPRVPCEPTDHASAGAPKVLQLSLTEAFYLAFLLPHTPPRLSIEDSCGSSSTPLSEPEAWQAFSTAQPRFAHNLAAFRALRQAGWRVRCGLKYGADFALYAAEGRKHATFCALVHVPALGDQPGSWLAIQQHSRVCGQVSKGLLLCTVESTLEESESEPAAGECSSSACLGRMHVQTLTLSPWWAAKEHGTLSL
mmetsp:Transcript_19960/g.40671  ORF Transcript_19960/g.40671 Transcript_19960/m.40671 type:complete len:234 (+) Transcript_19960:116-817(+)